MGEPPDPPDPDEDPFSRHYHRGRALLEAEQFAEAIREYAAAYQIEQDPALLFHLAWAYRQLGKPQEALVCFERYLQAEPDLAPAARARVEGYLGELRARLPRPPAAPEAPAPPPPAAPALQVPQVTPSGTYKEHYERAIGHHRTRRYEDAIREFLCAYKLRPVAALLFNVGCAYRALSRPREALEFFELFDQQEPDLQGDAKSKLAQYLAEARAELAQRGG